MAKKSFRFSLFHKKSKGPPGGIEVKTTIASNYLSNNSGDGNNDNNTSSNNDDVPRIVAEDEVSAMTPATGMPPDSPDRLRNLASLLRPPSQSTPNNDTIFHEDEEDGEDHTAALFDPDFPDEDELSAMTPMSPDRWEEGGTNMKKGKKKYQLRWKGVSPRNNILPGEGEEDDACSPGEVTVYEEDEASSLGWELLQQQFQQQNHKQQNNTAPTTIDGSLSSSSSWLTRTRYFQKAIDSSFELIDVDKSGDVTLEELYAGLLLIHLNMAVYVGPPACRVRYYHSFHRGTSISFSLHINVIFFLYHSTRIHKPASKAYVTEIFHLLDTDNSGTLSKDEYATVVKILYSQVFTRIVMQWSLTLMSELLRRFIHVIVDTMSKLTFW